MVQDALFCWNEEHQFFAATTMNDLSNRNQIVTIVCVAFLCYAPFVNKPLNIDGDMLVHTARQFLVNPLNPPLGEYGRHMVLHDRTHMPESSVFFRTGHPPLLPLLLAPVVAAAGDRQWPLHAVLFVFYLAAIAALWGVLGLFFDNAYRLYGSLLFATCPSLLVNSHNIMWDVAITALTLASFFLFLAALRSGRARLAFFSGVVAGAAALTKSNALPLFLLCPLFFLATRRFRMLLAWVAPGRGFAAFVGDP